jgi:hypothetical protein
VYRGQVGTERRPLNKGLSPVLSLDDVLGLVLLVVPVDTNAFTFVHNKLITASAGRILEEPSEMLLLGELVNVGGLVGLVNSAFSSISLDVGELVHAQDVLLVEGDQVELASGGGSLSGRRVFNKSKP